MRAHLENRVSRLSFIISNYLSYGLQYAEMYTKLHVVLSLNLCFLPLRCSSSNAMQK